MKTSSRHKQKRGLVLIRERLGLSQQQLAEHLEVSRSMIAMAERNERHLPCSALAKLAELEKG